jgi:ABC-type nitrate/sulfonate/bicarbonate transport system substrate-binding protein
MPTDERDHGTGGLDRRRFLQTAGAGALSLAGAGLLPAAASAAAPKYKTSKHKAPVIAVTAGDLEYPTIPASLPLYVGLTRGYFKEYGLNPVVTAFAAGGLAAEALESDQIQFADFSSVTAVSAFSQGFNELRALGQGFTLGQLNFVVNASSNITSIADLAGKKITTLGGTTAVTYYVILEMLKQGNLSPSQVTFVNVSGLPPALTALQTGEVDCAVVTFPQSVEDVQNGELRTLFTSDSIVPPVTGTLVYTSAAMIGQHPTLVQAYVNAYAKSQQWIRHNRVAAAALLATNGMISPSVTQGFFTQANVNQGYVIEFPVSVFRAIRAAGVTLGTVSPNTTYYSFADPTFATAAAKLYAK